ncbi:hypothetical protein BP00DRAFT_450171 [Aspergillus indologenus CBS 114.80]|uniref:Uncharacterized protein n=1 Tax=Aspergillus indologenus CBS 114.80 TaxID=1450541 RepID=A0A2V5HSM7_9EURO|nr:hypothetical protein BP00DRAFT_450171 [Aspergillus indologenus CBS 114.80]
MSLRDALYWNEFIQQLRRLCLLGYVTPRNNLAYRLASKQEPSCTAAVLSEANKELTFPAYQLCALRSTPIRGRTLSPSTNSNSTENPQPILTHSGDIDQYAIQEKSWQWKQTKKSKSGAENLALPGIPPQYPDSPFLTQWASICSRRKDFWIHTEDTITFTIEASSI